MVSERWKEQTCGFEEVGASYTEPVKECTVLHCYLMIKSPVVEAHKASTFWLEDIHSHLLFLVSFSPSSEIIKDIKTTI